jgi:hypothetical protein
MIAYIFWDLHSHMHSNRQSSLSWRHPRHWGRICRLTRQYLRRGKPTHDSPPIRIRKKRDRAMWLSPPFGRTHTSKSSSKPWACRFSGRPLNRSNLSRWTRWRLETQEPIIQSLLQTGCLQPSWCQWDVVWLLSGSNLNRKPVSIKEKMTWPWIGFICIFPIGDSILSLIQSS